MEQTGGNGIRRLSGLSIGLLVLVLGLIVLRTAWVCDDAYASFRVVDNLVHGHGLTWNTDERVQAFTNPLWVFVMSLFYLFTGDVYYTSIFLSLALVLTAAGLLMRRISGSAASAALVAAILICSRAFVEYSTSGLENPLSYLLAVVFAVLYFQRTHDIRTLFWLSLVAALCAVNRLDTILLFIPALLLVWWRTSRKRGMLFVAAGFAPLIVWEVFSVVYYGFPFPNTYYAKLHTGISAGAYVGQGLIYLVDSLSTDPLTLLAILAAFVVVVATRDRPAVPIICGILLYLVYVVRVGGDFMSGRFLAVPVLLSVTALARWRVTGGALSRLAPVVVVLCLGLATPRSPVRTARDFDTEVKDRIAANGIADERAYFNAGTALVNQIRNRNSPAHTWGEKGKVARAAAATKRVVQHDAIGFYGYFAGPDVHVLDAYGLGEPLLARLPAEDTINWRIGYYIRSIPDGYEASVRTGHNQISDTNLACFYDRLLVVTRGPVFSWPRFKEIWRMAVGDNDHLLARYVNREALDVTLDRVNIPKAEGTRWDVPGNLVLPRNGVRVDLGTVAHHPRVELSLDHNDRYRLYFRSDTASVDSVVIPVRLIGGGLRVEAVAVPQSTVIHGYSSITVVPDSGDGKYSLGHLRLVEDSTATH